MTKGRWNDATIYGNTHGDSNGNSFCTVPDMTFYLNLFYEYEYKNKHLESVLSV